MFSELSSLILFALVGAVVGAVLSLPLLGLFVGIGMWGMLQFIRLLRLRHHLLSNKSIAVVSLGGMWGDIYRRINYLKQVGKKREERDYYARLEDAVVGLPYGFVIVSRDGRIEWFNTAASKLLQLSHPDDIGREIRHLIRQPHFAVVFEDDRGYAEVNLNIGGKFLAAYVSTFDEGAYRLIVVQDMTRVRYLERARSELLGNVAHELKTPLTVIKGYADIISGMAKSLLNDKTKDAVMHISKQAVRMNRIVDDLLMLERLEESQQIDEDIGEVNLRQLADEMATDITVINPDNQCHIKIDIAEGATFQANRRELYSVLSNLVSNAVRYSPEDGVVRILWSDDKNGKYLAVSDEGPGIDPIHLPRLTERFYRADKSRSRDLGGTGLGLAIVKRILQRYGASLRIESELDKGSVFYCDFPTAHHVVDSNNISSQI